MSDYAELVKRLDASARQRAATFDADLESCLEYEAARAIEALSAELESVRDKALEEACSFLDDYAALYGKRDEQGHPVLAPEGLPQPTSHAAWCVERASAAIRSLMSEEPADAP